MQTAGLVVNVLKWRVTERQKLMPELSVCCPSVHILSVVTVLWYLSRTAVKNLPCMGLISALSFVSGASLCPCS